MSVFSVSVAAFLLAGVTFIIVATLRADKPWLQPVALLRAAFQLTILSLIVHSVFSYPLLTPIFLIVMTVAATWTSFSRLRSENYRLSIIGLTILISWVVPVGICIITQAIPFDSRYVLALSGIVIGAVMNVTSLMGKHLREQLAIRTPEHEGMLALGATYRQAAAPMVRKAISMALMPATDQTRTTGLVTLPGAFVGAIFAGAPVEEAAMFQIVVLASVLCGSALATASLALSSGAPRKLVVPSPAL